MRRIPGRLSGAAILIGLLAAGHASAASLTLDPGSLVAAQLPVTACDAAVSISWTTEYDAGLDAFTVDVVSLEGVDAACDGHVFQVTLADAANAALGSDAYPDPAGPAGQVDPGAGANQTVAFDLTGQGVPDGDVALSAWSITP